MQGIGERTIGEGEGIDFGVIGDEGSTACTIVEAPFETLLREATMDEASGLQLLDLATFGHRDERLVDGALLPHIRLTEGMADLLVGQYTPIILLKYQACDAEDIPLTYGLPFVCALLGGFPLLGRDGLILFTHHSILLWIIGHSPTAGIAEDTRRRKAAKGEVSDV